jgi:hypothetical protein
MQTYPTQPSPDAAWTQVLRFRVYKDDSAPSPETARVFKNKRQRCAIQVEVVVGDKDGFPISINMDEIERRLRLVHYSAEAPELGTNNDGYAQFFDPGEFEWDESILLAAERFADDDKSTESEVPHPVVTPRKAAKETLCTVYVEASPTATNKRVGARFLLPDDTSYAYTTHSQVDDPNGDGDGNGLFNSSVNIQLVKFPSLPVSNYGDVESDGTLIPSSVGSQEYYYRAAEHFLHVNLNGNQLKLKSVSATEGGTAGFAVYKRNSSPFDPIQWGISYYSQPGSTTVQSLPLAPLHRISVDSRQNSSGRGGPHVDGHTLRVTTTIDGYANVDEVSSTVRFGGPASDRISTRFIEYPKTMYDNCVGTIVGADAYSIVIGLLLGHSFPVTFQTSAGGNVSDVLKATLHIMDVYGNDHALSISLGSDPSKMKLSKV